MRQRHVVLVGLAALALSACGGAEGPADFRPAAPSTTRDMADSRPSSKPAPSPRAGPARVVTTGSSEFGTMLFDRSGQAIYLFEKESTNRPECYGACAAAWPPVRTGDLPQAQGGVRAELLDVTSRRDGTRQVTYAGHPLYFYAHEDAGQVLCHDVTEFGGRWLVVTPSGEPAA